MTELISVCRGRFVGRESTPSFKDRCKSTRYAMFQSIRDDLRITFSDNRMSDEDQLDFFKYMENSIKGDRHMTSFVDVSTFDFMVNAQLQALPLVDRNELIRLLTHRPAITEEKDVKSNDDILTLLPSLQKRSTALLKNNVRKQRADKVDLTFISDFMHDYCRYCRFVLF